jgi:hypothetical protein
MRIIQISLQPPRFNLLLHLVPVGYWQVHGGNAFSDRGDEMFGFHLPYYILPQSEVMCKKGQRDANDRWATRTVCTITGVQQG